MTQNEQLQDHQISAVVLRITGMRYSFATVFGRVWGKDGDHEQGEFWQLMPDGIEGLDFFNWYCDTRMYCQFFKTKGDCLSNFLFNWCLWQDEKRKSN